MRRLGADVVDGGVHFALYASRCAGVTLVLEGEGARDIPMQGSALEGFHAFVPGLRAGATYRFRPRGGDRLYPDPASRWQPAGPHGPSMVVDPRAYAWRHDRPEGVRLEGQVLYELHVGTFTAEGTYAAAARELVGLAELGITMVELMPLADFPGEFGWGYDGVNPYSPAHMYGSPDDLRALVDAAHAAGLSMILDVVYNHLGPDGNYLPALWADFWATEKNTDWGEAIDFDGPHSAPVRAYFCDNAAYWIEEFHFDGLRLDATQQIHDGSPTHVIADIVSAARAAAPGRAIVVVAENEPEDSVVVRPRERGGYGCDAMWNDDLHHSAVVAATGRGEAYYSNTQGTPQELISGLKWGPLFQGQYYTWQSAPRGRPALDLPAQHFVTFLHNHDQVANSARGQRLSTTTSPGRLRALSTLFLLGPGTPMLFQGEEYDATTPFFYFADHGPELSAKVRVGRLEFLAQFPSLREARAAAELPDPADRRTFERCKLDRRERDARPEALARTRALLALRRTDPVFRSQRADRMHGAVLGPEAFLLRFLGEGGDDRLLLVNLGPDLSLRLAAEPLLAPPLARRWSLLFSSEDPRFGGSGTAPLDASPHPFLPGHCTLVLAATLESQESSP